MATYVNDLRLTELATGEGSGTWGTTTNTNLELIGEALGYGTQDCFASDADATTTVADGASDPARAMYFKVTSSASLTATRTLTIAPNTVSRVMLIENATTGSQSITISQGSGGNVTIASGQTKMVYLDGAGAGAAVVDALADLELGTITVANLTATTADINGGTIDGVTIGGSSAGAGSFTTLNTSGAVVFNEAGADVDFRVEGDTDANLLFVDAGNDRVGIGTGSPATALDVNGTVTADSLTTNEDQSGLLTLGRFSSGFAYSLIRPSTNATGLEIRTNGGNATARFLNNGVAELYNNASKKLETTATGIDVTGTVTADGLTVDTDTGITLKDGADTRTANLFLDGGAFQQHVTGTADIVFYSTDSKTTRMAITGNTGDISFYEDTGTTPKFFWDASAERLGLGTSSPSTFLDIDASQSVSYGATSNNDVYFEIANRTEANGQFSGMRFLTENASGVASWWNVGAISTASNYDTDLVFQQRTGAATYSEAMRIDSSGNLLVGTTDATPYNNSSGTGLAISAAGQLSNATNADAAMLLNRMSTDGSIIDFKKDGTTVGSIGSRSGSSISITGGTSDLVLQQNGSDRYAVGTNAFYPTTDNNRDLGALSLRWDDVYATNGTINTSDANEKQDIAELDEAERRVAIACKGLLRKFRWKSAVAEKGDDARIHFGIIAQDLQAAFEAEGLDAGRYAMFIHSTWTDEETGEERSRMGVRYSELLAFIIAAL